MIKIILNFYLNAYYKQNKFFKILSKKNLKFISSRRNNIVTFNLSFILLLTKVNSNSKKYINKKEIFITRDFTYIKMIFILFKKIVIFYIEDYVLKIRFLSYNSSILKYKVYLKIF